MTKYTRWQNDIFFKALKTRRVLILAGPRQCGKTTLAKKITDKSGIYYTLDDPATLTAALDDPRGFVRHGNNLMIIDEIQRAPLMLMAIKQDVDENTKLGRFLITGSANIQSLPQVKESLAGRVRKIRLRPLSMGEIFGNKPNFISNAFNEKFLKFNSSKKLLYTKDQYLKDSIVGGFPEALQQKKAKETQKWHKDYIESIFERDLLDIANIRRKTSMYKLIEILAAWSAKFMDIANISSGLSISRPTLESYINALESLYLIERVPAWCKNDYARVGKQDKLFMADSGLMASILRVKFEQLRFNADMTGKLMETFVFQQLAAIVDTKDGDLTLYHYRDREKREIDFIVENEDGDILGIEVKSGSVITKDDFKHLFWFQKNMIKNNKFVGIVLYSGENILPFGKNFWAVPISCLWA